MGASKKRKQKFLRDNPVCCFCGGKTPSEEPDHIPSRAFFLNKQWPEGYEFPACVKCNRASRYDEMVVAMLSRMYPDPISRQEEDELEKFVKAVNENIPKVISEIKISAAKKKRLAKEHGYTLPPGKTSQDLPFLSLDGERTNEAISSFSRKLFLALYFKHTNAIFPETGGFAIKWYSNVQMANGAIPEEISSFLHDTPTLTRNSKNLDNQFNYEYYFSECHNNAVFSVSFRKSFHILAHMNTGKDKFNLTKYQDLMKPYSWG